MYSVRFLLLAVTAVALLLAVLVSESTLFKMTLAMVFAANVIGAMMALFVTYGMKLPRDGSYRHGEEEEMPDDSAEDSDSEEANL